MIDHVSIAVRDLTASALLYDKALAPLGLTRLVTREATVGFGKSYPEFWLNVRPDAPPAPSNNGTHICLRAPNEAAVRAFHAAALASGCATAGDPGPRQGMMTGYIAAFIVDPDGNKIEAATFPKKA